MCVCVCACVCAVAELKDAMAKLKVGGLSGILPELPFLLDRLLVLMQSVWRKGCMFQNWRDVLIVPVPKKGDLRACDNWHGISVL